MSSHGTFFCVVCVSWDNRSFALLMVSKEKEKIVLHMHLDFGINALQFIVPKKSWVKYLSRSTWFLHSTGQQKIWEEMKIFVCSEGLYTAWMLLCTFVGIWAYFGKHFSPFQFIHGLHNHIIVTTTIMKNKSAKVRAVSVLERYTYVNTCTDYCNHTRIGTRYSISMYDVYSCQKISYLFYRYAMQVCKSFKAEALMVYSNFFWDSNKENLLQLASVSNSITLFHLCIL